MEDVRKFQKTEDSEMNKFTDSIVELSVVHPRTDEL